VSEPGRESIPVEKAKMGKLLPNRARDAEGSPAGPAGLAFVEGVSASMRPVEAVIRELAQSDVPVLVLAEAGAGKHATAQRIHQMSQRSAQPFRWFQCLGLEPAELEILEDQKNYDQKNYDQKNDDRKSDVSQPNAGTVYLQELADLSAECQERLLEALPQSPGNSLAGSERARLICGSARDLEVEVKRGRLREDLYYRISGVCLRLPPLRQRKEDIPFLMGYFLRKYARDFRRTVPDLSAETLRLFLDYSWPGNLRELEDAARVLVALGDEHVALGGLRALLRKPEASSTGAGISLKAASRAASREAEKELILNALTRTRWNRRRAAEELQISYKALLYKLKQIGFEGYGA
jgi:two-component system response regulator AtoC